MPIVAGIDVHKRSLMVVASSAEDPSQFRSRRFGTGGSELDALAQWLAWEGVREVVMESTAQYWKPVWLALESQFSLHLAQAHSNRAPHGRKTDFRDAQRLVRRFLAGELILSFVPDSDQRQLRLLTRRRVQQVRARLQAQAQLEALLEDCGVKLSSVISDLLGSSGRRILQALAEGESDPARLAALGDRRLQSGPARLADALQRPLSQVQRDVLRQALEQIAFLDQQIEQITAWIGQAMQAHQQSLARLCQVPGIRSVAAQQIIAELGPCAETFPSPEQLSSWAGVCPGRQESAGENRSGRSAKGNRYLRRVLCQCAQAAVRTRNSWFESKFRRLLPRLGFAKSIWAIAHHLLRLVWKILHENAAYEERCQRSSPQAILRRMQRLRQEWRRLGYDLQLVPISNE